MTALHTRRFIKIRKKSSKVIESLSIFTFLVLITGCASTPKENVSQPAAFDGKVNAEKTVEKAQTKPDTEARLISKNDSPPEKESTSPQSVKSVKETPPERVVKKSEEKAKNIVSPVKPVTPVKPEKAPEQKDVVSEINVVPVVNVPVVNVPVVTVPVAITKDSYKDESKKETPQDKKPQPESESVQLVAKAESANVETVQSEVDSQAVTDIQVTLDGLPMQIDEGWVLNRESDLEGRCELSYRRLLIEDGQGETPVNVIVTKDLVSFKTRSNIDLNYEGAGITIDGNPQLVIENLVNQTSISFKAHYQKLIGEMKKGEIARLTLGFWPTWPMTQTYDVNFELGKFSLGYEALMQCVDLEKELK